jgi:hypothetical protein
MHSSKSHRPWLALLILLGIALAFFAASDLIRALLAPEIKEAKVEQTTFIPAIFETPTARLPDPVNPPIVPRAAPTPVHNLLIELPAAQSSGSALGANPVYDASYFLSGYLTNRTYPIIVDATPWSNGSVNYQQYRLELGGVSYWDFWSEHENWNSPSYLYLDDNAAWQPYRTETVRTAAGREATAYLLVDRKGPGAMDKIWFTQDAVWMLETERSRNDVGPIKNMDELVEWGNLDKLGTFRVEVDDRIAYDGPVVDWFSGKALGLSGELAQALLWRHREFGSSGSIVPVLYQNHLRVLVYGGTKKPKWFMATGVRFPSATRLKPFSISDFPRDALTRLASNALKPEAYIGTADSPRAGERVAQADAPATIRFNGTGKLSAIQFIIAKKYDPKQLWLRIKYGSETGIDLPFIAFFGDQEQLALHRSTPIGSSNRKARRLLFQFANAVSKRHHDRDFDQGRRPNSRDNAGDCGDRGYEHPASRSLSRRGKIANVWSGLSGHAAWRRQAGWAGTPDRGARPGQDSEDLCAGKTERRRRGQARLVDGLSRRQLVSLRWLREHSAVRRT